MALSTLTLRAPVLHVPVEHLPTDELFRLYFQIMEILADQKILRNGNGNNFTADWAEYLFCHAFDWEPEPSGSQAGYDATDKNGTKYQIKARTLPGQMVHVPNPDTEPRPFEILAVALFTRSGDIDYAARIPWKIVREYARPQRSKTAYVLTLSQKVRKADGVKDVTERLQEASDRIRSQTGATHEDSAT